MLIYSRNSQRISAILIIALLIQNSSLYCFSEQIEGTSRLLHQGKLGNQQPHTIRQILEVNEPGISAKSELRGSATQTKINRPADSGRIRFSDTKASRGLLDNDIYLIHSAIKHAILKDDMMDFDPDTSIQVFLDRATEDMYPLDGFRRGHSLHFKRTVAVQKERNGKSVITQAAYTIKVTREGQRAELLSGLMTVHRTGNLLLGKQRNFSVSNASILDRLELKKEELQDIIQRAIESFYWTRGLTGIEVPIHDSRFSRYSLYVNLRLEPEAGKSVHEIIKREVSFELRQGSNVVATGEVDGVINFESENSGAKSELRATSVMPQAPARMTLKSLLNKVNSGSTYLRHVKTGKVALVIERSGQRLLIKFENGGKTKISLASIIDGTYAILKPSEASEYHTRIRISDFDRPLPLKEANRGAGPARSRATHVNGSSSNRSELRHPERAGTIQRETPIEFRSELRNPQRPSALFPRLHGPMIRVGTEYKKLVHHENRLSKNAFVLPENRFGAENANLVDLISDAIWEELGYLPIISIFGSASYLKTENGTPDWDAISDIDIRIHDSRLPQLINHDQIVFVDRIRDRLLQKFASAGLRTFYYSPNAKRIAYSPRTHQWGFQETSGPKKEFDINLIVTSEKQLFSDDRAPSYKPIDYFFGDTGALDRILTEKGQKRIDEQVQWFIQSTLQAVREIFANLPILESEKLLAIKRLYQLAYLIGKEKEATHWIRTYKQLTLERGWIKQSRIKFLTGLWIEYAEKRFNKVLNEALRLLPNKTSEARSELRKLEQTPKTLNSPGSISVAIEDFVDAYAKNVRNVVSLTDVLGIDLSQGEIVMLLPNLARDPAALFALIEQINGKNKVVALVGTQDERNILINELLVHLPNLGYLIEHDLLAIITEPKDAKSILGLQPANSRVFALGYNGTDETYVTRLKDQLPELHIESRTVDSLDEALGLVGAIIEKAAQNLRAEWLRAIAA